MNEGATILKVVRSYTISKISFVFFPLNEKKVVHTARIPKRCHASPKNPSLLKSTLGSILLFPPYFGSAMVRHHRRSKAMSMFAMYNNKPVRNV